MCLHKKTQQIDIIIHPNKELENHIPMRKGYSFLPMPGTGQDLGFQKSLDQMQVKRTSAKFKATN
jgi:hypothetical protein